MDLIQPLENAIAFAARTVEGVKPEQFDLPTPCTDWNVRTLAEHLVRGQLMFAAGAAGADPSAAATAPVDDLAVAADALRAAAARSAAGWAQPGAADRMVALPWGETPGRVVLNLQFLEACSHGWDLARATGQSTDLDDATLAAAMHLAGGMLTDDRRGVHFKPAQPVADDAPAFDKLAAFMGRTV